jgi:hypothetical protein
MNAQLASLGYELGNSKYSPALGYTGLRVLISGRPTQRLFDVRLLCLPTFDGRFLHQKQITRHELEPNETLQACLGELRLETHRGENLRAFSFGGSLRASVEMDDLYCEFASTAPIFTMQSDPGSLGGGLLADEITDLLAEKKIKLAGHEDELFSRLSKFEPYPIFLACLVSLQKRLDSVPIASRHERYRKVSANLKRAVQIIHDADGWDGHSPSLEDLLSGGGA